MELFWSLSLHEQYGKYNFQNKCSALERLLYDLRAIKRSPQRNLNNPHNQKNQYLCGSQANLLSDWQQNFLF